MAVSSSAVITLLVLQSVVSISGHLDDVLNYYETLHHIHVKHRVVRRSLYSKHPQEKQIEFDALGRHFQVHLQQRRGLFAEDFHAYAVDSNNVKKPVYIDKTQFYEGYVEGMELDSSVSAFWEKDAMLLTIKEPDETYVVEPSWRHLPVSKNYSMIAYRGSDLKMKFDRSHPSGKSESFCGFVHPDHDEAAYQSTSLDPSGDKTHKERQKRATSSESTGKVCTVMLVADYHFYQDVGQSSIWQSANYLVGLMNKVDQIYKKTDFNGYLGLGLEIGEVLIHTAPTNTTPTQVHYNMRKDVWVAKTLLREFSKHSTWSRYCLAHLFTSLAFSDGVLGLAWIASDKAGSVGGICSPPSAGSYYNTGWSSSKNRNGNRLLTQEADIVTAHEFGHNWGSQHDPATSECAPSSRSGGKYMMYTYAVSGYDRNNKVFSPCSTRSIGNVLRQRYATCFQARSTSFCGNLHVEAPDEQCDAGNAGKDGLDPCCDQYCKLKPGALCSYSNDNCCTRNCTFAQKDHVCYTASSLLCEGDTKCSGFNATCPIGQSHKPQGSPCGENGTCSNDGQCHTLCEANGKIPCICDTVATSCMWCCKSSENSTCEPFGSLTLPDGKPCIQGSCKSGKCMKEVRDLTDKLWEILDKLSVDYVVRFMKNNLVGTIIVFSLILYVPLCIIVACVDYHRDKKEEEELAWHNSDNFDVVRGDERRSISTVSTTRRRPKIPTDEARYTSLGPRDTNGAAYTNLSSHDRGSDRNVIYISPRV